MNMIFEKKGDHAELLHGDTQRDWIRIPAEYDGLPVTEISTGAFRGNSHLKCVTLPMSIQTISERAFENCQTLQCVGVGDPSILGRIPNHSVLPPDLCVLEGNAFANTNLVNITFTGDVSIGPNCFFGCSNLKSVVFYRCSGNFEDGAFSHSGIEVLHMPDGKSGASLPTECFSQCKQLRYVRLNAPATIEDRCFSGCKNLATLCLSADKPIPMGRGALEGCKQVNDSGLYRTALDVLLAMGEDASLEVIAAFREAYYDDLEIGDVIMIVRAINALLDDLSNTPSMDTGDVLIVYIGTTYHHSRDNIYGPTWHSHDRFALFSKESVLQQFQVVKEWNQVQLQELSVTDIIHLAKLQSKPTPLSWDWNDTKRIFCSPLMGTLFNSNPRRVAVELLYRYLEFSLMETHSADSEMHIHAEWIFNNFSDPTGIGISAGEIEWLKYDHLSNEIGLYHELVRLYTQLNNSSVI